MKGWAVRRFNGRLAAEKKKPRTKTKQVGVALGTYVAPLLNLPGKYINKRWQKVTLHNFFNQVSTEIENLHFTLQFFLFFFIFGCKAASLMTSLFVIWPIS